MEIRGKYEKKLPRGHKRRLSVVGSTKNTENPELLMFIFGAFAFLPLSSAASPPSAAGGKEMVLGRG